MKCQHCGSTRVLEFSGKCNDLYSASLGGREYDGYALHGVGLGGGDYVSGDLCLNCKANGRCLCVKRLKVVTRTLTPLTKMVSISVRTKLLFVNVSAVRLQRTQTRERCSQIWS